MNIGVCCVTSKRLKGRESGVWILNSVIFGGDFQISLCTGLEQHEVEYMMTECSFMGKLST